MDSFFFNITDTKYKVTSLDGKSSRIDISNGIVYFDITSKINLEIKNIDRMVIVVMLKSGEINIKDNIKKQDFDYTTPKILLFVSSIQDLQIKTKDNSEVFILFVADFFLKRYLSLKNNEPIDFLYKMLQKDFSLKLINSHPTDALSLYIIEKLLSIKKNSSLQSLKAEHRVVEFMIHIFLLIDIFEDDLKEEDISLALKAKEYLLQNFVDTPTISELAHLCATNESKLKKAFKNVYKTTIYKYIQKLRLNHANMLLKEENLSIKEIAKKVGYSHQGHFSKLFYGYFGVLPKELK